MGVDIFFVISGYLICGGILEDLQSGSFSIISFYHRRIRRIFPAYFALIIGTMFAGLALYHWARLIPLAQTTLFSALFSTNLYFWLDMGYFQPSAHENPLLNLWSLGVEEQFYIFVPILTLALWRLLRGNLKAVFFLGLLSCLGLCLFLGKRGDSTTAFYILPSRAWELLAGAMLANLPRPRAGFRASLLSVLGLGLVLLSFWCFSTQRTLIDHGTRVEFLLPGLGSLGFYPFPGLVTVPVVIGSMLLLRYGGQGPVSKFLASPPMVGIGKISYSLYLWHWPLLVFGRYIDYDQGSAWVLPGVVLLSFLCAYLSWRWVETPIRLSKSFTPRVAFLSSALGIALVVALCVSTIQSQGFRTLIHAKANAFVPPPRPFLNNFEKFSSLPAFRPDPAHLDPNYLKQIGDLNQKPTFCLFGDSHAEALAPGLDKAAAGHRVSGIYITMKMHPYVNPGSKDTPQQLLEWVAANPDIRDVYLVGRWLWQYKVFSGLRTLGETGPIKPVELTPETSQAMEDNFRNTARWFIEHGKRVFIFSCIPEYVGQPCDLKARSQIIPLKFPLEASLADYTSRQAPVTRILTGLEKEGLITVIHDEQALSSADSFIFMSPEGEPYYQDTNHLTPLGAYTVVKAIAPLLWSDRAP